ncbi:Fe(3+)-hydroxamate ABC transporter permease FhuB [Starkeya koreensis]|uniref:Fe(3+)-hydroxamate ABC transporter permease FhuB n=1 Tax=Ancylobacter koreensis TaxID=266121 RepID=A0ABT0DQB6_9HYPH|nr:Fe(3+)-hydroxamate ABC transporter permease FhuB [Ancylobacter koreensis]MCK0209465.1 Fe(3+)-hydroxamate ABC transporter permease FhuB [Ancylobacter koreensis]
MTGRRASGGRAALLVGLLLAAGIAFTFAGLATRLPSALWWEALTAPRAEAAELVFRFGLLPRLAVSLLAGAALGLSGALFAHVLRNPLAEPSTLGTSAGAGLALAFATLYAPFLLEAGAFWVTLAGALAATGLALAIAWRQSLSPLALILAGLVVGMVCGSMGGVLVLFEHHHLSALFLWQAGSLAQNGWQGAAALAGTLAVAGLACLLLLRPLAVLELDDAGARGLGAPVAAIRLGALGVAAALAAAVVANVGVVAFIGLAGPALARLAGARTPGTRLAGGAAAGALLLWLADQLAQLAERLSGVGPPTGLLTALLGAPLLLVLLPRLRDALPAPAPAETDRKGASVPRMAVFAAVMLAVPTMSLLLGRGGDGWWLALPGDPVLDWRWPRIVSAFGAGAMLGLAGTMIQRVSANPMASPEILGISSGAAAGATLLVILAPVAGRSGLLGAAFAGAVATTGLVMALGRRFDYAPQRLLLTGVALTTIIGAALGLVMLSGHPRLDLLLRMMAGSTYLASPGEAGASLVLAVTGVGALVLSARALGLFGLGAPVASSLGLPVRAGRLWIVALVSALTAAATLVTGPLSFVGLVAPHAARLQGFRRPLAQGVAAMAIGGTLMVLADWIGRTLAFPWQMPAGLIVSLAGGPYFLWLMLRRRA